MSSIWKKKKQKDARSIEVRYIHVRHSLQFLQGVCENKRKAFESNEISGTPVHVLYVELTETACTPKLLALYKAC